MFKKSSKTSLLLRLRKENRKLRRENEELKKRNARMGEKFFEQLRDST